MKKLLFNRKPVEGPWGGGNLLVKAICSLAHEYGYEVTHRIEPGIDAILLMDPRPGNTGVSINEASAYKARHPGTKIIHRVNECDARKGTTGVDVMLRQTSQAVDHTVFVSNWMKDYHVSQGGYMGGKHHVIYNGVDTEHFRSGLSKVNNDKINIVAHHWSNNRMKGFDAYEAIDEFVGKNSDRFTFTYIGRENGTFKHTNVIAPCFGERLGRELSRYDVYISGSVYDPGPNHIIEAIACYLPTYVIASGGGAVEFAGKDHAYETIDDLIKILEAGEFAGNRFRPRPWVECVDRYFDILDGKH